MAINATARLIGADAVKKRIQAVRDFPRSVAQDPRIADLLVERTRDRFRTKRAPDGSRWRALSRTFFKRKVNPDRADILVDRGDLRDSIGVTKRQGLATGFGFRIGVTDPRQRGKLATHQRGGRSAITGGVVPARPIIGISPQDVTFVERLVKKIAREKGVG